ncbi:MAG: hypothetical protein ACTSRG_01450 [Candidatus Helarchaeota archaeon]
MEKPLKRVKTKKQRVNISEEEKKLLEKYKDMRKEPEISNDEASVLDILTKRKTLDQITREFNISLKPLNKPLYTKEQILEILNSLDKKLLVTKIKAPIGDVWVAKEHMRYTLRGTDKL